MNKKTEEFFKTMLQLLPSTNCKYKESIKYYGEVLEITIIEEIFMPAIIKLLHEHKNIKQLENIFNYFEDVSTCDDEHLLNIISVGALEVLGNDRAILKIARDFMGPKTIQLQIEADRSLGRI